MSLSPVDEFFSVDDFATSAVYTDPAGDQHAIIVIFDAAFAAVPVGGVVYQSSSPMATCRTVDVSDATPECTLEIAGTTYNIVEIQPDGTGITLLTLSTD